MGSRLQLRLDDWESKHTSDGQPWAGCARTCRRCGVWVRLRAKVCARTIQGVHGGCPTYAADGREGHVVFEAELLAWHVGGGAGGCWWARDRLRSFRTIRGQWQRFLESGGFGRLDFRDDLRLTRQNSRGPAARCCPRPCFSRGRPFSAAMDLPSTSTCARNSGRSVSSSMHRVTWGGLNRWDRVT